MVVKTTPGTTLTPWQKEIEREVREALKNDLLTWAKVVWKEPTSGIGPPDLLVRAAYLRPPHNGNVYELLEHVSEKHCIAVRWECFQDEDRCDDDDGYPFYWDDAVTFSPW